MMYRTVIWKDPNNVNTPPDVDRNAWITNMQNALSDFESNYKSQVEKINSIMQFDTEVDYETFKSKIDGTTVSWEDVAMFEDRNAYYLYVEA